MSVGSECLRTVARWRESFDFMVSPSLGGVRTAVVIALVRAEEKMQLVRCNLDRSSKRADWIGKRYRLVQQSILLFTPALRKQSFFSLFFFSSSGFSTPGKEKTRRDNKKHRKQRANQRRRPTTVLCRLTARSFLNRARHVEALNAAGKFMHCFNSQNTARCKLFLAGSIPEGLSPVHPEDSGCCITNQISSDKMDPAALKNIYIHVHIYKTWLSPPRRFHFGGISHFLECSMNNVSDVETPDVIRLLCPANKKATHLYSHHDKEINCLQV